VERRLTPVNSQRPQHSERHELDPLKSAKSANPEQAVPEDESFDASEYVRQLIARMGNNRSPSVTPVPPRPVAEAKPVPAASLSASPASLPLAAPSQSRQEIESHPTGEEPTARRARTTGQRSVDLKKLRETANLMTNSALQAFDCKSLIRQAYSQLAVAVCSMVTGLVLLSMNNDVHSLAFRATAATLMVSAVATYRYTMTTRVLQAKLRPQR
jgi:hypothetical protein